MHALRRLAYSTAAKKQTLTLYVGGKTCTLCEGAKDALDAAPGDFEVVVTDIFDREATSRLKRLYQYDIPVLAVGDNAIARGKITQEIIAKALAVARRETSLRHYPEVKIDLSAGNFQEHPEYERTIDKVLGLLASEQPKESSFTRTCWNCGSPDHELSGCPLPRDQAKIGVARQAFVEHRASSGSNMPVRNVRLHDAEASRTRTLDFISRFRAGVVSHELREALEFGPNSNNFPWLYRFLTWGYPPGYYVNEGENPYENMRRRVAGPGPTAWTTYDLLEVDEGMQTDIVQPPTNAPNLPAEPTAAPLPPRKYRFVNYNTHLFNSELLPVCFPERLPPMDGQQAEGSTQTRNTAPLRKIALSPAQRGKARDKVPPWRLPGAMARC